MCRIIQTLIAFFFLEGCTHIDNKVGYGTNYEVPIERSCLVNSIKTYGDFKPVTELEDKLLFEHLGNEVEMSLHSQTLLGGYILTIDGMFKGKSYEKFVNEAELTKEIIRLQIGKGCF